MEPIIKNFPQKSTNHKSKITGNQIAIMVGVVVFLLGLFVRLIDITDPPLDFNPTRQLRSAIIARGLYYQSVPDADPELQKHAVSHMNSMERLEPTIMEHLVAFTYRIMGDENLWVSRIFSALFWVIGGFALFDLGRRMTSLWGAQFGIIIYLFIPFSIQASRSFQPDPLMVMLISLTAWSLHQWGENPLWKWTLLTGFLGGMAIFVKGVAVFFIGGMAVGMVGFILGADQDQQWRLTNIKTRLKNPQIWVMMGLMILPIFVYYLAGSSQTVTGYSASWTIITRWREVVDPSFFMHWAVRVNELLMLPVVLIGLVGTLVVPVRDRTMLWGLWIGYFLFGVTFPYHTLTHDYYHLPLIFIVAISIPAFAEVIVEKVSLQGRVPNFVLAGVVVIFTIYNGWIGRSILVGQDYSHHPEFWQNVAGAMPIDGDFIGYSQDYGFRLMYYGWRRLSLLPPNLDSDAFKAISADENYFLSTAPGQLSEDLKNYLETNFTEYASGIGYTIYLLTPNP